MARKCFMCGHEVTEGILCEKCDKPRRKSSPGLPIGTEAAAESSTTAPESQRAPFEPQPPVTRAPARRAPAPESSAPAQQASSNLALDPFPKAPIVPFPLESSSLAITSVVNLLVAAGVPSILLAADRSVKFVSDEAKRLFDATQSDLSVKFIEEKTGLRITGLTTQTSAGIRVDGRNILYSLVPMSGGATGAALIFRPADPMNESRASFVTYLREAVFGPLRTLHESLTSAARAKNDHFLHDAANAVDQVIGSLELAPEVEESAQGARPVPTVTDVVRRVAERFVPYAALKGIELQVDAQELDERFADHDHLAQALAAVMDNALHYVPAGGQVVIGVRWMEHKGRPLLLFFVMDNGPLVPEHLRQEIFEPTFIWNPSSTERTGRGLFKCREFALAHSGSVWVESKTGKACTFFLRVRPDGTR
jgi:hypothetical protein